MILDKGICTIFSVTGTQFSPAYALKYQSWYAELSFETSPAYPTEYREDVQADARVRVHQNRAINNRDVLYFSSATTAPATGQYQVTRAYHGIDDENGQPITDLTLQKVN